MCGLGEWRLGEIARRAVNGIGAGVGVMIEKRAARETGWRDGLEKRAIVAESATGKDRTRRC